MCPRKCKCPFFFISACIIILFLFVLASQVSVHLSLFIWAGRHDFFCLSNPGLKRCQSHGGKRCFHELSQPHLYFCLWLKFFCLWSNCIVQRLCLCFLHVKISEISWQNWVKLKSCWGKNPIHAKSYICIREKLQTPNNFVGVFVYQIWTAPRTVEEQ